MNIFDSEIQQAYWDRQRAKWEGTKDIVLPPDLLEKLVRKDFPGNYKIIPDQEALERHIGDAQIIVVGGAYFGDEGKGKWTDIIASLDRVKAVVRVNSADNAAHSISHNGEKLIFHLIPSAINTGKDCYIGSGVTGDLIRFVEGELEQLIENNISYDNLKIDNMRITTPYHRIMDIVGSANNSTTGSGVGPSFADEMIHKSIRLDDLYNSKSELRGKLEERIENYQGFLVQKGINENDLVERLEKLHAKKGGIQHLVDFAKAKDKAGFLIDLYDEKVVNNGHFPKRANVDHELNNILESGGTVLLEGPQGDYLSPKNQQFSKYPTSDDITVSGIVAASKLNDLKYEVVAFNIHKFPAPSKVGKGDAPASSTEQDRFADEGIVDFEQLGNACIDFDTIQKLYFESINPKNGILEPVMYEDDTGRYMICEAMAISSARKFGEKGGTTNKPRITGVFDCVLAHSTARRQGPNLVISAMDRGDDCDYVGLTIGYVVNLSEESDFKSDNEGVYIDSNGIKYRNGDIIKVGDQVPAYRVLEHCRSITKVMPGWKDTPIGAKKGYIKEGDELPVNVCNVISTIEQYTGFEVVGIGNGVNSDDRLFIKRIESNGISCPCSR